MHFSRPVVVEGHKRPTHYWPWVTVLKICWNTFLVNVIKTGQNHLQWLLPFTESDGHHSQCNTCSILSFSWSEKQAYLISSCTLWMWIASHPQNIIRRLLHPKCYCTPLELGHCTTVALSNLRQTSSTGVVHVTAGVAKYLRVSPMYGCKTDSKIWILRKVCMCLHSLLFSFNI